MISEPSSTQPVNGAAMSPAYIQYQRAFFGLMHFFQVNILLAESIPLTVEALREHNPATFRRLSIISTASPEVRDPAIMQRVILELVICRLVDHFKVYLCDVIENALTISPDLLTLNEAQRERIRRRYQTTSEDDLRTASIIDAVDRISDSPLADFLVFFQDTLGINLHLEQDDVDNVTECLAVRNILVHTRGRVNERFLRRTGRTDLAIGDLIGLSAIDCQHWSTAMGNVAQSTDTQVLDTFGRQVFLERFAPFYVEFLATQEAH